MINFHKTLDRHEGKTSYKIEKRQVRKKAVEMANPNHKAYTELGIGAQLDFSA